jgi:hypothetical protein
MVAEDLSSSPAWRAGADRAIDEMAAYRRQRAAVGADMPVSRTAACCSVLASPHLLDWPEACREWLWTKATRWPKGMEHPHHAITRDELNLPR